MWYGCDTARATVYESAYHWYRGFLCDAGYETGQVIGERKLYSVACDAALLDFRPVVHGYPELIHKSDYTYAQSVGARVHREGHPGILIPSVRYPDGESHAVFTPAVLSSPRLNGYLTYRLEGQRIFVERTPGVTWFVISTEEM